MAIHENKMDLFKESIYEMLHVAKYTVTYRKTDHTQWGDNATGGILGFPATVILFSIIDCLGSFFAKNSKFMVNIDGKMTVINRPSQHIYILNSKYFNLDLSLIDLNKIYENVRSTLTHNSLLPAGYFLDVGENQKLPINIAETEFGDRIYIINVIRLFEITGKAVGVFIDDLDRGYLNFKTSNMNWIVSQRDVPSLLYKNSLGQYQTSQTKWIKK